MLQASLSYEDTQVVTHDPIYQATILAVRTHLAKIHLSLPQTNHKEAIVTLFL